MNSEEIKHLNDNINLFHERITSDSVEEYDENYGYMPDLYVRVCADMGLSPLDHRAITESFIVNITGNEHMRNQLETEDLEFAIQKFYEEEGWDISVNIEPNYR